MLETYNENKSFPKGLQIKVRPTFQLHAEEHVLWEKVLEQASLNLTEILLSHCRSTVNDLSEELAVATSTSQISDHHRKELDHFIQKKKNHLTVRKQKKLARDDIPLPNDTAVTAPPTANPVDTAPDPQPTPIAPAASHVKNNVVNLSSATLTDHELSLLNRGLSFCPNGDLYNEYQLHLDLDNFARQLRLKEYFHDKASSSRNQFGAPSNFTPDSNREKALDMYIKAVQRDILRAYQNSDRGAVKPNVTKAEHDSISALKQRSDIVIKKADKGGALVIMDKETYIAEGMRQLGCQTFYRPLENDPTNDISTKITKTLKGLKVSKKIDDNLFEYLLPHDPKPGRFYMLPKIHKPGNPGRPIVSSNGTSTEKISTFVDHLLKDIPPKFPSYIKDTNHFLQIISDIEVPTGSLLVTLDVTSLYTNIPHDDGIHATVVAYEKFSEKPYDSAVVETLISLILTCNNFEFDNRHYIQINGTAMGTKMAPNYANIFMGDLEGRFLSTCQLKPLIFKRFLDDIFMLWPHSEDSLLSFIENFGNMHPTIQFTHAYSRESIDFLDVHIGISNGTLVTNLYRKPTDSQQYLSFHSCHPRHTKLAIPYSQALRYRRICSQEDELDANLNDLQNTLVSRNFPQDLVKDAICRARRTNRSELLKNSTRPERPKRVNLTVTFNGAIPNLKNILKRHHPILTQSQRLGEIFPEPPRIAYRRARNLQDHLVNAKVNKPPPTTESCHPCNGRRCQICIVMQTADRVQSTNSNFQVKIKTTSDCNSSNVVYLLECNACKAQYIGQTTTSFRIRFNNHRSDITKKPNLPVSRHFNQTGHSFKDIHVYILQSGFPSDRSRQQRESFLIHKFQSTINEDPGVLSTVRSLSS
ncbi:uncharacterized protein LOC135375592 [Ornithodoros turicata]|uniref:uncharacterized protein LOC135375592 n=1 Tax=Ornithodoros turicata TaxID=34597 RepID=UPI003139E009